MPSFHFGSEMVKGEVFDGGYKIKSVKYNGKDVKYTVTDQNAD